MGLAAVVTIVPLSADALPSTVGSDPPIQILKEVNEQVTVTQGANPQ